MKAKAAPAINFAPMLDVSKQSKDLRSKVKSRLLSETAKVAEEGKKKREEMKLKLADTNKMGKYTLCADRPASAPTQASSSGSMVFSPTPLHALELAPAKHTKTGLAKKMNAKSHYTTEYYATYYATLLLRLTECCTAERLKPLPFPSS